MADRTFSCTLLSCKAQWARCKDLFFFLVISQLIFFNNSIYQSLLALIFFSLLFQSLIALSWFLSPLHYTCLGAKSLPFDCTLANVFLCSFCNPLSLPKELLTGTDSDKGLQFAFIVVGRDEAYVTELLRNLQREKDREKEKEIRLKAESSAPSSPSTHHLSSPTSSSSSVPSITEEQRFDETAQILKELDAAYGSSVLKPW